MILNSQQLLGQPDALVCSGLCSYSSVLVGSVTTSLYALFYNGHVMGPKEWSFMVVASSYW